MMIASSEVCGKAAWGSVFPTVQAYWGPLGSQSGIEFESAVVPQAGSSTPNMAYWYAHTAGITTKPNGMVCIPVIVRRSVP